MTKINTGFDRLDIFFTHLINERNVPGCAAAVYHKHKPVYSRGFGFADIDVAVPFTPDTLVCLYSATKVATASTVMALVDDGLIGLDDRVSRYLPEFGEVGVADGEIGWDGALRCYF